MENITNPAELRKKGLEVLVRELGYLNAMRFMLQYESGHGDYVQERRELFACSTLSDVLGAADRRARGSQRKEQEQ